MELKWASTKIWMDWIMSPVVGNETFLTSSLGPTKLLHHQPAFSEKMLPLDLSTVVSSAIAAAESSLSVILVLFYGFICSKVDFLSEDGERVSFSLHQTRVPS